MWPISVTWKIEHTLGSRLGRIPHQVGSQPFLYFPNYGKECTHSVRAAGANGATVAFGSLRSSRSCPERPRRTWLAAVEAVVVGKVS